MSDKVEGNLEIMVATHPHEDHIGGLDIVLENYNVETIIDSGEEHTTKTYEDYRIAVNNEENATFIDNDDNMVFEIAEDVYFTVIEIVDDNANLNNNSIVCRLDVGEISFLFTGDLESEMEIAFIDKFEEIDVLKVGHHGSSTSTSQEFINKINPKYGIISCGADNKYGHPAPETITTLNENNISTYRTDLQGTIIAETDGIDIDFNKNSIEIEINTIPIIELIEITKLPSTTTQSVSTYFITETGSKYHNQNCQYLKHSAIAIEIEDITKKYQPCSRCF